MTDWNFCKTTSFANAYRVAQRALKAFGYDHQRGKCLEELEELQHAFNDEYSERYDLHDFTFDEIQNNLIDEIADVWLTTLQMAEAFGIERVIARLDFKVERLDGIIEMKERADKIVEYFKNE